MFDPYHKWLGIRDPQRPPNHYRLLGVELFETDVDVIQTSADRQMAHVRQYQSGEKAEISQQMLNEIAQAKVCLLRPEQRSAYDQTLKAELARARAAKQRVAGGEVSVETSPQWRSVPSAPAREVSPGAPVIRSQPQSPTQRVRQRSAWPAFGLGGIGLLAIVSILAFQLWRNEKGDIPPVVAQQTSDGAPSDVDIGSSAGGEEIDDDRQSTTDVPAPVVPASVDDPSEAIVDSAAVVSTAPDASPTIDETSVVSAGSPTIDRPLPVTPAMPRDGPAARENPVTTTYHPPWTQTHHRIAPREIPTKHPCYRCLLALQNRDIGSARREATAFAQRSAKNPVARDAANRLDLLVRQFESFWDDVERGLVRLKAGDTLVLREVVLAVNEIAGNRLTLAHAGDEHTYLTERDELDSDLAIALAEFGTKATGPARDWMIGSFLSLDGDGDLAQARYRYAQAKAGGMPSELLLTQVTPARFLGDDHPAEPASPAPAEVSSDNEAGVAAPAVGVRADARQPLPSEASQAVAQKLINELYADQLGNTAPLARRQLAAIFLRQAAETKNDLAARYLLLTEAARFASETGDIGLTWKALDGLSATYAVDIHALRADALVAIGKKVRDRDSLGSVVERGEQSVDAAILADEYDAAMRLARIVMPIARRTKDPRLSRRIQMLPAAINATAQEFEQLSPIFHRLAASPDDVEANAKAGRFLCYRKGDFVQGLPMLAKGNDETLKELAQQELALLAIAPSGVVKETIRIADAWWDLSKTESAATAGNLKAHSRAHYARALPELAGLDKARIEKRLLDEQAVGSNRRQLPPLESRMGGTNWQIRWANGNIWKVAFAENGAWMADSSTGASYNSNWKAKPNNTVVVKVTGHIDVYGERGGRLVVRRHNSNGKVLIEGVCTPSSP